MICPTCGYTTIVLSTAHPEPMKIKRRRQCLKHPEHRFNTWEITDPTQSTLAIYAQRLANRGFTQEAIENILEP